MIGTMDFETYSEAGYIFNPAEGRFVPLMKGKPGLWCINAATYARHPSTRVISLAYDIGTGKKLWIPGCSRPDDLFDYISHGGLIEAHNSLFEYYIWNYVGTMGTRPPLPLTQLKCSASKARAWGLPGALGKLSEVLNPAEKKDKRGTRLIQLLSVPKKPTKKCSELFRSVEKYPELHVEMYEYNIQDVMSEEAISAITPKLSEFELSVWQLDQKINTRGAHIDVQGMQDCINIFSQAEKKYTDELRTITGGAVQTVGEITKNSAGDKWLQSKGVNLPSLDKEHVAISVEDESILSVCRRVLEIRQIIGGASVKKLFAMKRTVNEDNRIRDLFLYCGAERTGRWAGRGPQPQNLRNGGPDCSECPDCGAIATDADYCPICNSSADIDRYIEWGNETTEAALATIATRDLSTVESLWGSPVDIIGSCMRGLFKAAPGHDLICSDYSAIEAVVIAAIAGEQWRLDVFNTHGKIYEASASQASGVPLQEILDHKTETGTHHPLRKKGKVRELAGGFGGWIGAWKNFGADKYMSDDEIKKDILSWRAESPMIEELWGGQWRKTPGKWEFTPERYGLEGAAVNALLNRGTPYGYRGVTYWQDKHVDVLYCQIPSGRCLAYHRPRLVKDLDPRGLEVWKITYYGKNRDNGGYGTQFTYSGKLSENVVQATARDILACAMLRVEAAGYPIVLHIHDEIVSEILKGFGSIEEFEKLMMIKEPWFADWPIKAAGGWRGKRYRK